MVPLLGASPGGTPGDVTKELAKLRLDTKDGEEGEPGKERRRTKRGEANGEGLLSQTPLKNLNRGLLSPSPERATLSRSLRGV